MRLIDKIWEELMNNEDYENENLTYLEINKRSFESLTGEFSQEFMVDDPSIDDLEEYFALKISVKNLNESFRLL